nr:PREDICTED: uncharacterized protein LOC109641736 [Paralichthys olivaceus]
MASTEVLLLQLLLVSLASASHNFGGMATYTYRGQNPDGTFRVDLRSRSTFRWCGYTHWWHCYGSNCGNVSITQLGYIDANANVSRYGHTCEIETITTTDVRSDKPFQMRADSCCWVSAANPVRNWHLLTEVDLGKRSDTKQPNRSPDIAILPFLRVPQNCPRTYKLTSFDPDGDKVRCRYGQVRGKECSSCNLPSGFLLDQDSCKLHYNNTRADTRVLGFELVVEDFPQGYINLQYRDGSRSVRAPLTLRRGKRAVTSWCFCGSFILKQPCMYFESLWQNP